MKWTMIVSSGEEHERFVASLEKHGAGMNGDVWSSIAAEMEWSIDDVKLYAYWYMQQRYSLYWNEYV